MSESYESNFGFGIYAEEEPITHEMVEEPASEDFEEFAMEVLAPAPEPTVKPKAPVTQIPKYEISQRPMRAKKRR